jgi:hypothetical protein
MFLFSICWQRRSFSPASSAAPQRFLPRGVSAIMDGDGAIMKPSAIQQYRPQGAASRRQFLNPTEPSAIN